MTCIAHDVPLGPPRLRGAGRSLRVALGGGFHEPVEGFWPVRRFGMIAAGFGGDLDDPVFEVPLVS
jgi:hypothetical protein